jgi:hypothetical protein
MDQNSGTKSIVVSTKFDRSASSVSVVSAASTVRSCNTADMCNTKSSPARNEGTNGRRPSGQNAEMDRLCSTPKGSFSSSKHSGRVLVCNRLVTTPGGVASGDDTNTRRLSVRDRSVSTTCVLTENACASSDKLSERDRSVSTTCVLTSGQGAACNSHCNNKSTASPGGGSIGMGRPTGGGTGTVTQECLARSRGGPVQARRDTASALNDYRYNNNNNNNNNNNVSSGTTNIGSGTLRARAPERSDDTMSRTLRGRDDACTRTPDRACARADNAIASDVRTPRGVKPENPPRDGAVCSSGNWAGPPRGEPYDRCSASNASKGPPGAGNGAPGYFLDVQCASSSQGNGEQHRRNSVYTAPANSRRSSSGSSAATASPFAAPNTSCALDTFVTPEQLRRNSSVGTPGSASHSRRSSSSVSMFASEQTRCNGDCNGMAAGPTAAQSDQCNRPRICLPSPEPAPPRFDGDQSTPGHITKQSTPGYLAIDQLSQTVCTPPSTPGSQAGNKPLRYGGLGGSRQIFGGNKTIRALFGGDEATVGECRDAPMGPAGGRCVCTGNGALVCDVCMYH